MFVYIRVLSQHRTVIISSCVVLLMYEVIRWYLFQQRDPCTREFYSEMYLIAKQEFDLQDREKVLEQVLDETLKELIRLQVMLEINSSVLHNSFDKLQKLFTSTNKNNMKIEQDHKMYIGTTEKSIEVESLPQKELKDELNYTRSSATHHRYEKMVHQSSVLIRDAGASKYSCREVYRGSLFGYPEYIKGFERQNCTDKIPFSKSVSLIIDRPILDDNHTVQHIFHHVNYRFQHVYLIYDIRYRWVFQKHSIPQNMTLKQFDINVKQLGDIMNDIFDDIKSPFAFIARQGITLIEDSDLERLIDVAMSVYGHNTSKVGNIMLGDVTVVGTAIRNGSTGEWHRNCFLSQLRMYVLRYIEGYESSTDMSCLRCNYMKGSFLVSISQHRRNITQEQPRLFNRNLTHGLFLDFFLRLKKSRPSEVLGCPDVLLDQYARTEEDTGVLLSNFANAWDIKKIEYSDSRVQWFGCRAGLPYTSQTRCRYHTGMALPPCCIENLKEAVAFIFRQCDFHNIDCQLIEGSVLGIVKFRGILPWERDVDIRIPSTAIDTFYKMREVFAKKSGYIIVQDESPRIVNTTVRGNIVKRTSHGGVLHIRAHGWTIQIFGYDSIIDHIDEEVNLTVCISSENQEASKANKRNRKSQQSKIEINGDWVYLPPNPGGYSRHRYGAGVYKHSEHWMSSRMRNGWEEYRSGQFQKCHVPGHHACLDLYEPDGDVRFQ